MIGWLIVSLFAFAVGGLGAYCLTGIKVKSGWQNGDGPIARWLDGRRRRRFNDQLPEALATMSNALRAGFSLAQAFDSVVEQGEKPMCEEFSILQQQLRIGMGFEDALQSMSDRVGSDDLTLVITAILVSRKTGGNVTEIFDKISDTIRQRMKIERKIRTLTAQGRMQGIIVSLMPLVLGVAMVFLKPKMMIPFLLSWTGLISVVAVIFLITVGWLIIRKITRIEI
ncbi:MAG: type II secretion system F family protein [Kiritimatiellae bacterium]|nr:type II secretion system F family protein [Kiritimatiellia bacterium]